MSDKAYSTFLFVITDGESDCYPLHFLSGYMRGKKLFVYKQAIQGKEIRQVLSDANYTASKAYRLFYNLTISYRYSRMNKIITEKHVVVRWEPDED